MMKRMGSAMDTSRLNNTPEMGLTHGRDGQGEKSEKGVTRQFAKRKLQWWGNYGATT